MLNVAFKNLQNLTSLHEEELIRALYLIRAPKHLLGIVPICKAFINLTNKYPVFKTPILVGNRDIKIDSAIEVLTKIANLSGYDCKDEHLLGVKIKKHKSKWTPLYPFTGDSVIGEILLITSEDKQLRHDFNTLSIWILRQVQLSHFQNLSLEEYKKYLLDKFNPQQSKKTGVVLNEGKETRYYNAYRELRNFIEFNNLQLNQASQVFKGLTEANSKFYYVLSQLTKNPDFNTAIYESGFDVSRNELKDKANKISPFLTDSFRLVLESIWDGKPAVRRNITSRQAISMTNAKDGFEITFSDEFFGILKLLDQGSDKAKPAKVIDVFQGSKKKKHKDKNNADYDPDEDLQLEPSFSLFLSNQNDLLKSYFQSKSIQVAVEASNSQIAWNKNLLSRPAIRELVTLLKVKADDCPLTINSKSSIALTLLTGRDIEETSKFTPLKNQLPKPSKKNPIQVDAINKVIYVFPGVPNVNLKPSDLCHENVKILELRIPPVLSALFDEPKNTTKYTFDEILAKNKEIIKSFPEHLAISFRSIRQTFIQKLLQKTKGDLGVQKVITDSEDANLQNIIHYASYPKEEVENIWFQVVCDLFGYSCEHKNINQKSKNFIGSPQSFNALKLKPAVEDFRQEIINSIENSLLFIHNLSMYLALWLGLATAGRSTKEPLPKIYLSGNWAYITDKSRDDGSTDRVVPLSNKLLGQIQLYIGYVSELSIFNSDLSPIKEDENGFYLQLICIDENQNIVPYQPKFLREIKGFEGLAANWGRKFVRSNSNNLPGRYKDALLGHFVRGRHPWDQTSTFNVLDFKNSQLENLAELEASLGFQVINLPDFSPIDQKIIRNYPLGATGKRANKKPSSSSILGESVTELILNQSPNFFEEANKLSGDDKNDFALNLLSNILEAEEKARTKEDFPILAEAVCTLIREETKIPLFLSKPRPLFSSKHQANLTDLQAWEYFRENYQKSFLKDLSDELSSSDYSENGLRVELGRLVMILIWRLGLNRLAVLNSFLKHLFSDAPILASGNLRYVILRIGSEDSKESMSRTVYLDHLTSTYLIIERSNIRNFIAPHLKDPSKISSKIKTSIQAYQRYLNPKERPLTLSSIFGASTQSIILASSPILGAYSRSSFLTEDLGDAMLRRLNGLSIYRTIQNEDTNPADLSKEEISEVPQDIVASSEILNLIEKLKLDNFKSWRQEFTRICFQGTAHRLIHGYGLWEVKQLDLKDRVGAKTLANLKNRIRVIAYVLLGEVGDLALESDSQIIDEQQLIEWSEIGEVYFSERLNRSAWNAFYYFLKDTDLSHLKLEVGDLGVEPKSKVSARIVTSKELAIVKDKLGSVESGIGDPKHQKIAKILLELLSTFGARRGETSSLRKVDFQENLIRIQPYGSHQLKTPSSNRVLPTSILSPDILEEVNNLAQTGASEFLFSAENVEKLGTDKFFDFINKLLQEVTNDKDLGLHHLRHTLASRFVASLLKDASRLDLIKEDFPWLSELLIDELAPYLNNEVDGGQGLRVLSTMLGHSHPTTTLRHYVHTLGICLYGALNKKNSISIERTFQNRVASPTTHKRWRKEVYETYPKLGDNSNTYKANQMFRDLIERHLGYAELSIDDTPLNLKDDVSIVTEDSLEVIVEDYISFNELEKIDKSLRNKEKIEGSNDFIVGLNLEELAKIPSGKRGSNIPRHPLELINGAYLPKPLTPSMVEPARNLCIWLNRLHDLDRKAFIWLINKWVHTTDSERGRMRLSCEEDLKIAKSLNGQGLVIFEFLDKDSRIRIKCLSNSGKIISKDTIAVRWVMTYVSARFYFTWR